VIDRRHSRLITYRAGSDAFGKAAFLLLTVLAAQRLPREAFGLFALGTTLGWMAAVVSDFGMAAHLARVVARRPDLAGRTLREWLPLRLQTGIAAILTLGVGLLIWRDDRSTSGGLILLIAVYGMNGVTEFLFHFFRGLSRSDLESTATVWQRAASLLLGAAVLWWRPTLAHLAGALLIPSLLTLAVTTRVAARLAPATTDMDADPAARRSFVHEVAPLGVGLVLSALYFRIDVLLLDLWQGPTAVAAYNAAFRIVEGLRLFPAAVLAVQLPILARALDRQPLRRVARPLTMGAAAVSVGLWLAAGWLVPLVYGAAYADAVPAFRILLISLPLMSLNYALTCQLIGWNGHRAYAWTAALALVVNLLVNAVLIPRMSMEGAAWSTLATEAALTLGCVIALRATAASGVAFHAAVNES
jgi:O-antigen/teichoic acid export membrane protein